ncbi:MAG: PRC-barrel domain-containing protein [Pseudomonadota bacterium]
MTTAAGHTRAILASRVHGTQIYNLQGESIGHVEDVVLDKLSNNILFAVVGFGGILSVGEKYHPIPWSSLNYEKDKDGYVVPYSKEMLEKAPVYDLNELTKNDGDVYAKTNAYYGTARN